MDAFEDSGQRVTVQAAVIEEHPIDHTHVEVLARLGQALAVTFAQVVVLQAERLVVDLVQNGQVQIKCLQTTLRKLYARVMFYLIDLPLDLFDVLIYISLLESLLMLHIDCECLGNCL